MGAVIDAHTRATANRGTESKGVSAPVASEPAATLDEQINRAKALAVAYSGSYAMTGLYESESALRSARDLYAAAMGDRSYRRQPVQSVLSGGFLRMYLDHKVDPTLVSLAGQEIRQEPEFKKLEGQLQDMAQHLGTRLLADKGGALLRDSADKLVQARMKPGGGGLAFRYQTNPIIGGAERVSVTAARIIKYPAATGTVVDYDIDLDFADTYDFDNKRTGMYDKYRKELASHLLKSEYDTFWTAFETETAASGKGRTKLDSAGVFASFMYAIERKGWTPGGLAWHVSIPARGTVLIQNAPKGAATARH
jgi:hypothetical protein